MSSHLLVFLQQLGILPLQLLLQALDLLPQLGDEDDIVGAVGVQQACVRHIAASAVQTHTVMPTSLV